MIADLSASPLDDETRRKWAGRARLYQQYMRGRHHVKVSGQFQEPVNAESGRSIIRRQLHDEEAVVCDECPYSLAAWAALA